jgi:hypothetical protein
MFYSRDAVNSRDANNGRDARSVGNNFSRKYVNSSSHRGKSRDFFHSRSSWDVNSSKNNNSSRHASNGRDHYNSWGPLKASGRKTIGHSNYGDSKIIVRR